MYSPIIAIITRLRLTSSVFICSCRFNMAPLNVGIIGYGGSAKIYNLPYIIPNPELAIYAFLQRSDAPRDPKTATPGSHCTVDYPDAKHYQSVDSFFEDANIDLVVVCTGPGTHALFAEKALRAGKNGSISH